MKITLIAACSDLGVAVDGAKLGANQLLNHWKNHSHINFKKLETTASKEYEKENLAKNLVAINEFNAKLYQLEKQLLTQEKFPITLGGDHSITIASSLAVRDHFGKIGIIWIDSHGDFNTFKTTLTGNLHGLPLACITGYQNEALRPFCSTYIDPKRAVIVGARDLDPLEKENLIKANVTVFTTDDLHRFGIDTIMEKAFAIANQDQNGVYVSYDLDIIDPCIAPGVSVKADKGITLDEALDIAQYITLNQEKIRAFDLVEFNPLYDKNDQTFHLANKILTQFIDRLSK